MMLSLSDIKDWLKKTDAKTVSIIDKMFVNELNNSKLISFKNSGIIEDANHFYIGKLDNKKEKSIGIYQLENKNSNIAIGGLNNTKIMEKSVSILIHWNNNAKETDEKALEIYYSLFQKRNFLINNIKVNYIKLLVPEPIDVGTDSKNIYERVIQAIFYYEKGSEEHG